MNPRLQSQASILAIKTPKDVVASIESAILDVGHGDGRWQARSIGITVTRLRSLGREPVTSVTKPAPTGPVRVRRKETKIRGLRSLW